MSGLCECDYVFRQSSLVLPAGYTYHLLHVQARPYIMLEDAGAGAFAYEVALERDLVITAFKKCSCLFSEVCKLPVDLMSMPIDGIIVAAEFQLMLVSTRTR